MHDHHLLPSPAIKYANGIDATDLYAGGRWYAINSQPSSENRGRLYLERQGWRRFYPVYETSARIGGRVAGRKRTLFSFGRLLKMDPDHCRWPQRQHLRPESVRKHGNRPTPHPIGWVEALIEITAAEGLFSIRPILRRETAGNS